MKKNCTLLVTTKMQDVLFIMHVVSKCMYDYKLIKCVIISRARIVYVFQSQCHNYCVHATYNYTKLYTCFMCLIRVGLHYDFFYNNNLL